ncbi:MAG TPA: hypothetical protein VIM61_16570 [Chthoniobacterales bacterium]
MVSVTLLISLIFVAGCNRLTKFDKFAQLEIVNKTSQKISKAILTQGDLRLSVADIPSGASEIIRWDVGGKTDLQIKLAVEFENGQSVASGRSEARNADKLRALVFDENIQMALIKTSW